MRRIPAILALVIGPLAIFWRLDSVPLWRDEATTAVWARLMVNSGTPVPYAYDRDAQQLLVQDDDGHDINSKLLPAMQSYLQFYVSAAGHLALGNGTLASRLPFALLGLASLGLLWALGKRLGGPCWLPYAFPILGSVSIYFLHAARQGRYYILIVFATLLLLLQVARYLREPSLARRWSFHAQLCLMGCLLYAANYLSFAATWLALGIFLLITDRSALARLCAASAVLAAVLGVEFWLLHAEYLTEWSPSGDGTFWEDFRRTVSRRAADLWRWVPFVALVPAAAFAGRLHGLRLPRAGWAVVWFGAALPALGILLNESSIRRTDDPLFAVFLLAFLCIPASAWLLWKQIARPGPLSRMALLAGLIVTVCPLFTVLVAGRGALPRYYYQACPASIVLVGLAASALASGGRRGAAAGCLALGGLWPNLHLAGGGTEQVVMRQYLRYDRHNGPFLEFLSEQTEPEDTIAYYRNVKGMVGAYYFPDRRWVNQLDSELPYNQRFRPMLPADQFDDSPSPDWVVTWDAKGRLPKALDESYELVWEYEYAELRGVWDLGAKPRVREFSVYRRTDGPSSPQLDSEP